MVELSVDVLAVRIPSNIGGLGGRDGRARDHEMRIGVSAVVLAVLGDVVSNRIYSGGALRRGEAGCLLRTVLCAGPHRSSLHRHNP